MSKGDHRLGALTRKAGQLVTWGLNIISSSLSPDFHGADRKLSRNTGDMICSPRVDTPGSLRAPTIVQMWSVVAGTCDLPQQPAIAPVVILPFFPLFLLEDRWDQSLLN